MLKTSDEIAKWLRIMKIEYFTINDDLSVDVSQNCDLSGKNLKALPFKIKEVAGSFFINNNQLTHFENFPDVIFGDFILSDNRFTSLKGIENINFLESLDVSYNQLTQLNYLPNEIAGFFSCAHNQLTSLKGSPQIICGSFFDCSGNQLTSLEGGPLEVYYDYYCRDNKLTSLLGIAPMIKELNCSYNQLINFDYGPEKCVGINVSFNKINTLKNLPQLSQNSLLNLENNLITNLHELSLPFSIDIVMSQNQIKTIDDLNLLNLKANIYQSIKKPNEKIIGLENFYQIEDKEFLRLETTTMKEYYLAYQEKKLLDSQITDEKLSKNKAKL